MRDDLRDPGFAMRYDIVLRTWHASHSGKPWRPILACCSPRGCEELTYAVFYPDGRETTMEEGMGRLAEVFGPGAVAEAVAGGAGGREMATSAV